MNNVDEVTINAPALQVWQIYSDVARWAEWTPSVTRVEVLDGERLHVGGTVRIKQPRMPLMEWAVAEVDEGRSWTWIATSPGVTTTATHEIEVIDRSLCRVTQRIEQRGPLSGVVGLLFGRRTRRYLQQEARGLQHRCAATWRADAATP